MQADETVSLQWTAQTVRVTAGILLAILVSAMDASMVATAMPSVARDLGSFQLYPWVFGGYLLTATTTMPLWGRAADVYGRRWVFLCALTIFVVASLCSGAAGSMFWLVLGRGLQGVGAGCLPALSVTIIADMFPLSQRSRLQGLVNSAWILAALLGPLIGALFASTVGWRWAFLVNLPIGIVTGVLLLGYRDPAIDSDQRGMDVRGALALTVGVSSILAGMGTGNAGAKPVWPLVILGVAAIVVLVLMERGSRYPIIPIDVFRDRVIALAMIVAGLGGALMFALSAFVPLHVQSVLGRSPYQAGAALIPASVCWSLVGSHSIRLLLRYGYERLTIAGGLCAAVGCLMLLIPPMLDGVVWTGCALGVIGCGMGLAQTPLLIAAQTAVGWERRGSVTALVHFSRTMCGAVGVSLLSVLMMTRMETAARGHGVAESVGDTLGGHMVSVLAVGLMGVFVALFVIAVAILIVGLILVGSVAIADYGRASSSKDR